MRFDQCFRLRHRGVVVLALLLIGGAPMCARAAYSVIDDDLYPTSSAMARRDQVIMQPEVLRVAFSRGSAALHPVASAAFLGSLPKARPSSQVRVVARIDAAAGADGTNTKQQALALARAATLRTLLIKEGFSPDAIRTEVDSSSNPGGAKGISVADVIFTRYEIPPPREDGAGSRYSSPPRFQYQHDMAGPSRQGAPRGDDRVIAYINTAVQNGQMSPAVAAQMIRSIVDSGVVANMAASMPTPVAPASVQHIATEGVSRWELDSRFGLKDNLDAWSRAAGWRPIVWEVSSFYQVTANALLDGGFPDVLRRIADSTGLNICPNPRSRTIRITDPGVACNRP